MITETSNISLPQIPTPLLSASSNNYSKASLKRPREDGKVEDAELRTLQQQYISNENQLQLSPLSEKPKKVKLISGLDGTDVCANSDKENGQLDPSQNTAVPMSPQSKAAERERKRAEKEEEKRKKSEAKAEREAAKQAKQQQKEEDKRRKEEEKKKKEEEKQRKEEEKKKKEEEKRKKEEEKRQKEEEKRQREADKEHEKQRKEQEKKQKVLEKEKAKEEKRKKQEEEEERKKKEENKQKSIFGFVTVKKAVKSEDTDWDKWYKPFQIPVGATVAPCIRVKALSTSEIEEQIAKGDSIPRLLAQFKKKEAEKRSLLPKKSKIPTPHEDDRDIPNQPIPQRKMKLLLFHDNVRPAYFGTFSKVSKLIKGRKPLAEDKEQLDYEFDSDAEWEDVSEGEDVDKSDAEDEEEPEKDPNDPDNEEEEFVVPDNYLSDDEGIKEDADITACADPQLKEERRKKLLELSKLKNNPQAVSDVAKSFIGPVFDITSGDANYDKLKMYKMIPLLPLPIDPITEQNEPEANSNSASPRKRGRFPEEALPQLLQLVHGSTSSMEKLVAEMQTRFPTISELQIKKKIKEVAVKEKREGKSAWYVHANQLNPQHTEQAQQKAAVVQPPAKDNITLPSISQLQQSIPAHVFHPQVPQQYVIPQQHMFHQQHMVTQPIGLAQPIPVPQFHAIPQPNIIVQPKVVHQQPVLPFVPSTSSTPAITPQPKPVNVLQIKRAPKPTTSSPVKPIQTFFPNPSSTTNDTPSLSQPTPMVVDPQCVILPPVVPANPGLVLDLNDVSSDHVME